MANGRTGRHLAVSLALPCVAVLVGVYVVTLFVFPPPPQAVAQASDPAAELYVTKCGGCHQPGGEGVPGTFPPLTGNEAATDVDYVRQVIVDGRSGTITVLGERYDQAMPAMTGLSDSEIEIVAAYVTDLAAGRIAADAIPVIEVGDGDPQRGHDLFRGAVRFGRGGAACASCHVAGDVGNLGGWSLGPDLTNVSERFGGEIGTASWLTNPSSETMQPLFAARPLADEEIAHLVAFLAEAPDRNEPLGGVDWLTLIGLGVLTALLSAMAVAWRGMRQPYTQKLEPRRV